MKSKSLLLTLLLAILVPWAANAQDRSELTVCNGTNNSEKVPFDGWNADGAQHNQMIFPATALSAMSGNYITQMVFYIDESANNGGNTAPDRLGTWTVSLGETTATTLTGLDESTTLSEVYEGYFDCSTGTLTLLFDAPYQYNGSNLLVDLVHAAAGYNRWYFLGVNQEENTAITKGTLYKFLPKTSFTYQATAPCNKPETLTLNGDPTTTTATLAWTGGSGTYNIEYKKTTDDDWTVKATDYTGYGIMLTSLTHSTNYQARVQSVCGGGAVSNWKEISFATDCAAVTTFPWTDNFDSYTGSTSGSTNNLPLCWNYINTCTYSSYEGYPIVYGSSYSSGHSGTNYLYFYSYYNEYYNYDPQDQYAILPEMTGLNGKQLTLWAKAYNASSSFTVGMMTDPANVSTFTALTNGTKSPSTSAYEEFTFTLAAGSYVAIMMEAANSSSSYRGIYIDDISISSLPSPTGLTCTATTTTTATLSWTAGGTETNWVLEYSTAADFSGATSVNVSGTPNKQITGLTGSTIYYARVKATSGTEQSSWSNAIDFTTDCEAVTTFPWTENFESYSAGDFVAPCWVNEHISGDGTQIFKVSTSATGDNTTHQLQLPDQSDGTLTKLRLPEMTLPNTNYQFAIDVYRNDSYSGKTGEGVTIYASTDGEITGATELAFIPRVRTVSNSVIPAEEANGWYTYELPIGLSGTCYIILKGKNEFGAATYMDNFVVEPMPTCARPGAPAASNVTNHSATITWTAPDGQTAWQLKYNKGADFDPATEGTLVNGLTAKTYTFDKTLDPASDYYVYVRSDCGGGDYSSWSKKCKFTTKIQAPKPSSIVKMTVGPDYVDLYWTAGGGDYETSYDIYYSTSSTPIPNGETTPTVSGITPRPTNESPYHLGELAYETTYYIWVRAYHGGTDNQYSEWASGGNFKTLVACPKPTALAALPAHTTADLSWTGYSDSYTVEYQTAAYSEEFFFDGFENGFNDQGWTIYTEGDHIDGYEGWVLNPDAAHSGDYGACAFSYYSGDLDADNWLITPQVDLQGTLKFWEKAYSSYWPDEFEVLLSTNGKAIADFTTILRTMQASSASWNQVVIDLSSYSGQGYIAIHHVDNGQYAVFIDDFGIYGAEHPAGGWQTATTTATDGAYTLTGLTANTKYDVRVKGNCDPEGEYSDVKTFTTLSDNDKIFTTAGNWNVAGNWTPSGAPTSTQNAYIRANVTIPSGVVASADNVTIQGTPAPTITIKDGGQLVHNNNGVTVTMEKQITGYTATQDHYYFLAPPFDVDPTTVTGMLANEYDLYYFDFYAVGEEWQNYKSGSFNLDQREAYLYANNTTTTLAFTGEVLGSKDNWYWYLLNFEDDNVTYPYDGWNLVGNLYTCNAYMVKENTSDVTSFYKINGNALQACTGNVSIAPLEGVFVKTETASTHVFWNRTAPVSNPGNLNIVMSQAVNSRDAQGSTDNAIISFGQVENLEKFQFNANQSSIYVPQDGKSYAVFGAEKEGELPLNFKAQSDGSYTLSFSNENVEFSYLHLIDKLAGTDTDLLANPSYSFEARKTDATNRFTLKFNTEGTSASSETFAYYDGSTWVIANSDNATLQMIDMMGRVVFSGEAVNNLSTNGMAPGVYVLRLVNGTNVKTQKIVVR